MTEWNASGYDRQSGLQRAMAQEVLSLLVLKGTERVLDVGCGNGRVTAEIARRVPQGSVIGVDPSTDMIAFASREFGTPTHPNLRFEAGDARTLPFRSEFDVVVSFNALHWIPDQDKALRSIASAMKPGGSAQIRLVTNGERKSLEAVLEETRQSAKWAKYFDGFSDPYLRMNPEEYAAAARNSGWEVERMHTELKSWDFGSREAFFAFGSVTFVAWAYRVPETEKSAFVVDVLDRYATLAAAGEENTFRFYQTDVALKAI